MAQADLVKRFRGDVDKFIGDAVFAHFDGPDMAYDAIRCAVEIQRAVEGARRVDSALPALSVGIGIATGEAIVGSIGSADRLDYTAIGPPVNLQLPPVRHRRGPGDPPQRGHLRDRARAS